MGSLIKDKNPGSRQRPIVKDTNENREHNVGLDSPNFALQYPNEIGEQKERYDQKGSQMLQISMPLN
jgi:hypothetical protein